MKQRYQFFNKLSTRVFITIWLSIAVMITLTVLLPRFDKRRILPTPEKEQLFYASKITHLLMSTPSDRFRDNNDHSTIMVIPDDISERYNVIHNIDDGEVINFIVSTLPTQRVYQQEINGIELVGPFHFKNDPNAYYIQTRASSQAYYLSRIYDNPTLLVLLMLLICVPFAAILSWSLSMPMKNLSTTVIRVGKGDWTVDRHIESQGPTEYRQLAKRFNDMITALNNAREEKNRLFANLSHELRTPLTRIGLSNSLIRIQNIESVSEEVQRINDNLLLVEERIQSMLALSKQVILNEDLIEPVALQDILIPLLEDASFEATERGKTLNYNDVPTIDIDVNVELFNSGLENIVRNAIHYAKTKIDVTLSVKNKILIVNIHDDGPGVLEKDLPQIFEPFYRGERPENFNDYGGSGLGLAIVSRLVETHNGTVTAVNDNGLSITLTLPLKHIAS